MCSAWLTGYDHPDIDKINQRIEDLTGLEMDTAEELQVRCWFGSRWLFAQLTLCNFQFVLWMSKKTKLYTCFLQVANYGVGGQYEPHFDFGRVRIFKLIAIIPRF